jgi:hypothetical protein
LIALAAALALFLIAVALAVANDRDALWVELGKQGMQLLLLAVIGGAVGLAYKSFEQRRESERRERDYRLGLFHDLVGAYTGVKAARRTLRALGFQKPTASALSAAQADGYRRQMEAINAHQLAIETINFELKERDRVFDEATNRIGDQLERGEEYLQDLIREWECDGVEIKEAATCEVAVRFPLLHKFLADNSVAFGPCFAAPVQEAWRTMSKRLDEAPRTPKNRSPA